MNDLKFIDEHGTFTIRQPENTSYLYFPLASETGLKSSVTPNLGGDAKIDQETFLLEPVSSESLHNNRSSRNFWCVIDDMGVYSATGSSAEQEADKFSDMQDDNCLRCCSNLRTQRRQYTRPPQCHLNAPPYQNNPKWSFGIPHYVL